MDSKETKSRIIRVLEIKGPSLPIQISRELSMNSLFVSAFLSELVNEKKIKMSHLKVGGSPLYFLDGQEQKLENFSQYLHPKEAEALLLLKNNKILKDSEQEPAIRVALRSIRDFAFGFKKNDEIYWRYAFVPEYEMREILEPKIEHKLEEQPRLEQRKIEPVIETKIKRIIKKPLQKPAEIKQKRTESGFQNPLIIKEEKIKKQKPKSNFALRIIDFIKKNNIELIEEKDFKAKEYTGIIQIKSQLGKISFLAKAKDKKTISESDLKKLLSESQKIPLPAFLIYTGEISKKAKDYIMKYSSILKTAKML